MALRALVGPTASGKTAVSLRLAESLGAEIVSVDSRQVYRGMEIGSAAPTVLERRRVAHHLVGIVEPEEGMSAGEFGRRAREALADIAARRKGALLVGGSGLYLRAALGGLDEGLPRDVAVRAALRERVEREGTAALHAELASRDPGTAARVSPRDAQRVTRALEILEITGRPPSELRRRGRRTVLAASVVVLDRDRADLEARIRRRAEAMISAGLLEEVRALLARGLAPDHVALRSVGIAETVRHLRGELSPEAWVEEIVVNTRRFAKRQRTWFRGIEGARWVRVGRETGPEGAAMEVLSAWGV